ncbi:putative glycolipid-binding domain-containing protein [Afifella sp. IM 167]|uniref:putative glycolipid-binding domain-containing protein n=1 Tax=Afifella sp. IM 167 TaxID=2033586 RepID=UPI001CCF0D39
MSGFGPVPARIARWRPEEAIGLEHLELAPAASGVRARGTIIGGRGGVPYGVSYDIACDEAWRTRSLHLRTASGRSIDIRSDGAGHWTDAAGLALPRLEGAIDVDLAGSAFTNTLPIRRLGLQAGERSPDLKMVYVPFDSFEPVIDLQIYTCLEPGARYLYQAADRSFEAELPVDGDGLVIDYPSLFRRLPDPSS